VVVWRRGRVAQSNSKRAGRARFLQPPAAQRRIAELQRFVRGKILAGTKQKP